MNEKDYGATIGARQITLTPEFNGVFKHARLIDETGDGILSHYVWGGAGDAKDVVLLLHGWLGTWYSWRKIMLPLAEKYTVIAPDMRGNGDSDKPETGYDALTMVEDVRKIVRELGFERLFVVGHDMGAPVAFCYAAKYQAEVRGLVYLDEPLIGYNLDEFTAFTPDNPRPYWWFGFHSQHNLAEMLVAGKEREYLNYQMTGMIADQRAITAEDKEEYLRTLTAPGGMRGSFGWYRHVFETAEQVRKLGKTKLKLPVLGLNGEFGHPNVAEQMKLVAENVSGGIISGSGHLIAEEKPDELVEELLKFFEAN